MLLASDVQGTTNESCLGYVVVSNHIHNQSFLGQLLQRTGISVRNKHPNSLFVSFKLSAFICYCVFRNLE